MALVELGFDEIPAKFLSKLTQQRKKARKLFGYNSKVLLTPRRIIIQFDKGKLKGELRQNLLDFISSVEYKSMRWKEGSPEINFVRPLRWILALDGESVIPLEIFGVKSGRKTFPHRTKKMKKGKTPTTTTKEEEEKNGIEIKNEEDFFGKMKDEKIEVSHLERAKKIRDFLTQKGVSAEEYKELFEMAVFSTESPTLIEGELNQLGIPPKIAEDILTEQVFVFPKKTEGETQKKEKKNGNEKEEGKEEEEKKERKSVKDILRKYIGEEVRGFIAVLDNPSPDIDVVRESYRFVIDSRFDDARFYINEDKKKKFSERIHLLEGIVYNEKFGSFYDRAVFMSKICDFIHAKLGIGSRDVLRRATMLCKADLTTGLVREFPEHQGYIGMIYAMESGESDEVAIAIYEHRLPERQEDPLPETEAGVVLSLADKLTHIFVSFITSLEITSEEDPFGIRRATRNAIRLMIEKGIDINIAELADFILPFFDEHMRERGMEHNEIVEKINQALDFIRERVEVYLSEKFPKDIVRGVIARTLSPYDAYLRAKTLSSSDFSSIFYVARRAKNIIDQAMKKGIFEVLEEEPNPTEEVEKKLLDAIFLLHERREELLPSKRYEEFIGTFRDVRKVVDEFFNSVMVLSENERERKVRLTLLSALHSIIDEFADFSLIEKR